MTGFFIVASSLEGIAVPPWSKLTLGTPIPPRFTFMGKGSMTPLLEIAQEGFYVRGVKVEQGPDEAQAVYDAFRALLNMPRDDGR